MVENGADLHAIAKVTQETCVYKATARAAKNGDYRTLDYLLEQGADIQGGLGKSPLEAVFQAEPLDMDLVVHLMERGCVMRPFPGKGYSAMHSLASRGDITHMKFLLERGYTCNPAQYCFSAFPKHLGATKFLLEYPGSDVNVQDERGHTLLHFGAVEAEKHWDDSYLEFLRYLIELGLDPSIPTYDLYQIPGQTPFERVNIPQINTGVPRIQHQPLCGLFQHTDRHQNRHRPGPIVAVLLPRPSQHVCEQSTREGSN